MDMEEVKKAITLERAQQDRIPYPSRHHTLLWFMRKLEEAIKELERLDHLASHLPGNIKCTSCGAVYPNPHIYPCTV